MAAFDAPGSPSSSRRQGYDPRPNGDAAPSLQDPTSGQSATVSGILDDPMSSLRAAALMTLKSKRRKPTSSSSDHIPSLPSRPAPTLPDIQLDYGDEPSSASVAHAPRSPKASAMVRQVVTPPRPASSTMDEDEGPIKEEGEISDSESPPDPKPPTAPPPDKATTTKTSEIVNESPSLRVPATPLPKADPKTSILSDKANEHPQSSGGVPPMLVSSPTSIFETTSADTSTQTVDAGHARPGLAMNEQQYDTAKDIVLDLLGWGVPPDYLVWCGLSREVVYYVFTDLNLRLPANLDIDGLVPYPPPETSSSTSSLTMPQGTSAPSRSDTIGRQSSNPHPSLPPKPSQLPTQLTTGLPSKPAHGASGPKHAVLSPSLTQRPSTSGTSLHDIEQQRRQELLARKAVQASRKPKQASIEADVPTASPSSSTMPNPSGDVEMAVAVPDETVDDFLNSIGPVTESNKGKGKAPPSIQTVGAVSTVPSRSASAEAMDIDTPIPGLTLSAISRSQPLSAQSSGVSLSSVSPSEVASPTLGPPPSSTESALSYGSSTETYIEGWNGDSTFDGVTVQSGAVPQIAHRRGLKRPVAADFVDLEPGPSHSHHVNGYSNGRPHPSQGRKAGSFASVSGMRRCVIDLSDSEEEEDESDEGRIRYQQGYYSPMAVPGDSRVPLQVQYRMMTPPNSLPPASLLEKEREIQRMRELIAQREQKRLRKLVETSRPSSALSSPSTPRPPPVEWAVPDSNSSPSTSIKEENHQPEISISMITQDANGTRTPALPANGLDDKVEEDIVMRDLTMPELPPDGIYTPVPYSANSAVTSGAVTPIDIVSNVMEHPATREQVLTAEARQEQVVDETQQVSPDRQWALEGMDLDTEVRQIEQQQQHYDRRDHAPPDPAFSQYSSLLERYPLLSLYSRTIHQRHRPASSTSSNSTSISSSSPSNPPSPTLVPTISSSSYSLPPLPDLKALKLMLVTKALLSLPDSAEKAICKYEVPGGGECRDVGCEDVHLSRIGGVGVELSDEHVAQYLHDSLAAEARPSAQEIKSALENVRWRHQNEKTTISFEERVAEAWALLGKARQ